MFILKGGLTLLVTLLYVLIFAITIALEVIIAGKSKNTKMWCVINYILLYFVSIVIGGVLGYFAGEIYAKKHMIFDVGFGHFSAGVMHSVVFIPFCTILFSFLYQKKSLNLSFTIIYIIETIGITMEAFFLLLIG